MTAGFMPGMGTPVWSPNLTPNSEPQYIGALLGLFILAIGFRGLAAAQGYLEAYLHLHFYLHTRTSVPTLTREDRPSSSGRNPFPIDSSSQEQDFSPAALDSIAVHTSSSGTPADQQQQAPRRYRMQGSHAHAHRTSAPAYTKNNNIIPSTSTSLFHPLPTAQPFVWQADVLRALLTTAVVGVGYMLMLVVMTYNSAYFAVILAGIFVGEVYFARWGRARAVHATKKSSSSSSTSFATSYREKQGVPIEEVQASVPLSQGDCSPLSASTLQSPQAASLRPSMAHRSPSKASSVVSSGSRSSYQPPFHSSDGAC